VLSSTTKLYLVLDLASGGKLFDAVAEEGRLSEAISRHYFHQLVDGMAYCHRRRVYHRNLKPDNLILSKDKRTLKIADFGLASVKAHNSTTDLLHTQCGTSHYSPPEMITSAKQGYHGDKVDVWASGIILYGMLAGRLPFDEPSVKDLYKAIVTSPVSFPKHFSYDVIKLLRAMLHKNPSKRATMDDVKTYPWFKVDYEQAISIDDLRPVSAAEQSLPESAPGSTSSSIEVLEMTPFPDHHLRGIVDGIEGKRHGDGAILSKGKAHKLRSKISLGGGAGGAANLLNDKGGAPAPLASTISSQESTQGTSNRKSSSAVKGSSFRGRITRKSSGLAKSGSKQSNRGDNQQGSKVAGKDASPSPSHSASFSSGHLSPPAQHDPARFAVSYSVARNDPSVLVATASTDLGARIPQISIDEITDKDSARGSNRSTKSAHANAKGSIPEGEHRKATKRLTKLRSVAADVENLQPSAFIDRIPSRQSDDGELGEGRLSSRRVAMKTSPRYEASLSLGSLPSTTVSYPVVSRYSSLANGPDAQSPEKNIKTGSSFAPTLPLAFSSNSIARAPSRARSISSSGSGMGVESGSNASTDANLPLFEPIPRRATRERPIALDIASMEDSDQRSVNSWSNLSAQISANRDDRVQQDGDKEEASHDWFAALSPGSQSDRQVAAILQMSSGLKLARVASISPGSACKDADLKWIAQSPLTPSSPATGMAGNGSSLVTTGQQDAAPENSSWKDLCFKPMLIPLPSVTRRGSSTTSMDNSDDKVDSGDQEASEEILDGDERDTRIGETSLDYENRVTQDVIEAIRKTDHDNGYPPWSALDIDVFEDCEETDTDIGVEPASQRRSAFFAQLLGLCGQQRHVGIASPDTHDLAARNPGLSGPSESALRNLS
jgi:serine/threonine protein kinase